MFLIIDRNEKANTIFFSYRKYFFFFQIDFIIHNFEIIVNDFILQKCMFLLYLQKSRRLFLTFYLTMTMQNADYQLIAIINPLDLQSVIVQRVPVTPESDINSKICALSNWLAVTCKQAMQSNVILIHCRRQ